MKIRVMTAEDIKDVIPLYLEEYNVYGGDSWTEYQAQNRLEQICNIQDSYCILAEEHNAVVGFAVGWIRTFYDLKSYYLEEIVVAHDMQGKGVGTAIMKDLEIRLKDKGVSMISLDAVNDDKHEHFYGKLGYKNVSNFVSKVKTL